MRVRCPLPIRGPRAAPRALQPAHRPADTVRMRITVLAGGIGAARFLRGLLAAAPDATDHRHRQHRRRHHPVRPARLPRPGLGDVHARRRHQRGAGLGPRGRDVHRIGDELAAYGAGPSWFTLGDLDFATHILPQPAARGGQAAVRGHPRAVRALAARRPAAADVRRPGRDPGQGSKDSADPLPGVVGPAARGRPGGGDHPGRRRRRPRPRPACSRRSRTRTSCSSRRPTRWCPSARSWPCPASGPPSQAKTVVGVSGIIGGAPVRGMADACLAAIGVETSAAAVAAHYGADAHRRLAGRRAGQGGGRRPGAGRHRGPRAAAVHARRPVVRRDRPGRHRPREGTRDDQGTDPPGPAVPAAPVQHLPCRSSASPGYPRSSPGDDLAGLIADAALAAGGPGLRDGDILVVTSKVVSKAEGRVAAMTREDAIAAETVRVVARRGDDDDLADQARVRDGRRRGGRVQHRPRHRRAAAGRPRRVGAAAAQGAARPARA